MLEQPSSADPEPRPADRLAALCRSFEQQWRQGDEPRLEDFLAQTAAEDRPLLLQRMLLLEWGLREASGQSVRAEPYIERFAEHPEGVRAVWQAWLERATRTLGLTPCTLVPTILDNSPGSPA